MFTSRYFTARHYAPRYWPSVGHTPIAGSVTIERYGVGAVTIERVGPGAVVIVEL